jgi:hypothetical protein
MFTFFNRLSAFSFIHGIIVGSGRLAAGGCGGSRPDRTRGKRTHGSAHVVQLLGGNLACYLCWGELQGSQA